jgi:hypothetical protein
MHVRWCPLRAPPPCPTCRICTLPCPPGSPPWPQRITATRASCPTVVSRRGRFGERNSDRRGPAPLRASGHARRRRARTHAAYVSRHGHPVVDGRVGAARRAVQRDPRPGPRAPAAVDAVGRIGHGPQDGAPLCQRLDVSGVVSTAPPATVLNRSGISTICTPRGVGRLFDSLKLWAWQLAPFWLPHCRGRWPDSGKQGRAPLLSGPTVPG